jgi:DNA-binding transcriptional ArsR family regulator
MVNYKQAFSEEQANLIFHSLSDPTRRKILERLSVSPMTVTEIAKPYTVSLPAISKQVKVLEKAKLIKREKQGREYIIRLEPQTLRSGADYLAFYKKFWTTNLNNLEKFLQKGVKNNG